MPVLVLLWADTGTGHRQLAAMARQAAADAGYELTLAEPQGSLWSRLSIPEVRLAQAGEPLFAARDLVVSWQPSKLLQRRLMIETIEAAELTISLGDGGEEEPEPASPPTQLQAVTDAMQGLELPLSVELDKLSVAQLSLQPGSGAPVHLSLTGGLSLPRQLGQRAALRLNLQQPDGPAHATVAAEIEPASRAIQLALDLDEPDGALVEALTGQRQPITAKLRGEGTLADWRGTLQFDASGLAQGTVPLAVSGDGTALRVSLQPQVTIADWGDDDLARLLGQGITGQLALDFSDAGQVLEIESLRAGVFDASGSVRLGEEPAADLTVAFEGTGDAYGFAEGLGWQAGGANLSLTSATDGHPSAALTVRLDDLRQGDLAARQLTASVTAEDLAPLLADETQQLDWSVQASGLSSADSAMQPLLTGMLGEAGEPLKLAGTVTLADMAQRIVLTLEQTKLLGGMLAGSTTIEDGAPVEAALDIADLPLAGIALLAGSSDPLPVDGKLNGSLGLAAGEADEAPALTANLKLAETRYTDDRLGALLGAEPTLQAQWPAVDISRLDGLELRLRGEDALVRVLPKEASDQQQAAEFTVEIERVERLGPIFSGTLALKGRAVMTGGRLQLTLEQPGEGSLVADGRRVSAMRLAADANVSEQVIEKASLSFKHGALPIAVEAEKLALADTLLSINSVRLNAGGTRLDLTGSADLEGQLQLDLTLNSADLKPLTNWARGGKVEAGQEIGGKVAAKARITGTLDDLRAKVDLRDTAITMATASVEKLAGTVNLAMTGDKAAVDGKLAAELVQGGAETPLTLDWQVTRQPEGKGQRVAIARLKAAYGDTSLSNETPLSILLAPAGQYQRITLNPATILLAGQRLTLSGTQAPDKVQFRLNGEALDLQALASLAALPAVEGKGSLSLDLNADRKAVQAAAQFTFSDLVMEGEARDVLAPYSLAGRVDWDGRNASLGVDGKDANGQLPLALRLSLPVTRAMTSASPLADVKIADDAPLSGSLDGKFDLALLNQIAEAAGHRLGGLLDAALKVGGTPSAPELSGKAALSGGSYVNLLQGINLQQIELELTGSRDALVVSKLRAVAPNGGTITGEGRIEPGGGDEALAIAIRLNDAQLIQSDLADAVIEGTVNIDGPMDDHDVVGRLTVKQAEIRIPKRLPGSVSVLEVEEISGDDGDDSGDEVREKPPAIRTGLDIAITAPSRVFVRGLGLDIEVGGTVNVAGTAARPEVSGSFSLQQGRLDALGQTWKFDSGGVSFSADGGAPNLNFIASRAAGDITATIEVSGPATRPVIKLRSDPELPEGEIAARLLFGTSSANLSAVQAVQATELIATLQGNSGGGILGTARSALGIDQLSVDQTQTGANVRAGTQIREGVYVGVSQGVGEQASEVEVQVDVTDHIKLEGTTGTGASSKVGVSVEWEY